MADRSASLSTVDSTWPGVADAVLDAFDAARQCLVLLSSQGIVWRANQASASLLGAGPVATLNQPLTSAPWCRSSDHESRQRVASAVARAASGRAARFSHQVGSKRDPSRTFDVSITPIVRQGESNPSCLLLEAYETTYHTKVEAALHNANAKLEHIFASALDPVVTIDAYGTIQSASRSLKRVFGYTPEDLIGRNVKLLMPEPHRSNHDGYLANHRRTGQTNILGQTRELEAVRRNGERFPIEISVSRVDLPSGQGPLFTGIIRDISERKRAEAQREESERRLRDMLERVELLGVMLDRDGRVSQCNRFLLRLTGWKRDEAMGADWFKMFLPEENRQEVRHLFTRALSQGEIPAHYENDIVARTGERRRIAWNNTILRNTDGVPIGVTALGVDVTEQRRVEQELARHREQLESLVADRTRELEATHEQLRLADRLASIGTLAAGLGHDMNNVLFPIRCRLDALDASRIPDDLREQFQAVRRSVAYLQQLSDGLRLLSMDPEQAADSSAMTNVQQWWRQVGPLLRKAVRNQGEFQASLSDDLPEIAVPPHRLTQAVLNLVTNAADAVDQEGTIRFWVEPFQNGLFVRFGVSDDGQGMSDEVKRQAMDPFFTTKKRGLGTGLGLSLVRGVVQSAGGTMSIDSRLNEGTSIVLNLPVARPGVGAAEDQRTITAAVTIHDPRSSSFLMTLLRAAGAEPRAAPLEKPGDSDLWILEPTDDAVADAQRFLAQRSGRQVIAFGPPSHAWSALSAIVISDTEDFEHIRQGVEEAIAFARGAPR